MKKILKNKEEKIVIKKLLIFIFCGFALLGITGCSTEETKKTYTQTTTITDEDGKKIITVMNDDGTKTVTVIDKDGTETTTIIDEDGTETTESKNEKKYVVTEYFYITDEKKFLKGTPVDVKNVKNNYRIYSDELANSYPNLYKVVKEIAYDFSADAYSGQSSVDISTYLYPTSFSYVSTGKIEYFFTLGQIYFDTDNDGFTDTLGSGYFIAPIKELEQKNPDLVSYINSELY